MVFDQHGQTVGNQQNDSDSRFTRLANAAFAQEQEIYEARLVLQALANDLGIEERDTDSLHLADIARRIAKKVQAIISARD